MTVHSDADKCQFMVRKLLRASRSRALTPAEVILLNALNRILTDADFAKCYAAHNIAALCDACNDPMWKSEGE